eukprot:jgi/Mesvir1/384/Mv11278-RA.2
MEARAGIDNEEFEEESSGRHGGIRKVPSGSLSDFFSDEEEQENAELTSADVIADLNITSGDLTLGELDMDSADVILDGLAEQLDAYGDHEVVKNMLYKGSDFKEYAAEVEHRLRQAELDSIEDYMSESDNLVALQGQINDCDQILAAMESFLGGFQADLGNISSEIKSLQEQSLSMSVKLRNRKTAEAELAKFIDDVVVPPDLITNVLEAEVNEDYLAYLLVLNRKLRFMEEDELAKRSAVKLDVEPELERLRLKAVSKVRDFLLKRFYGLRKPKTNIQILQQNVLLKFKYLVTFLKQHGADVYPEVKGAYVETLSKVLTAHFRTYISALTALQSEVATKSDLLGVEESRTGLSAATGGLLFGTKVKNRTAVLSLGERNKILKDIETPAIIPHVAESEGQKHPYEVLFRSLNKLLMDTATSEYMFCNDFFGDESVFQQLFAGPLAVVTEHLSYVLSNFYDVIGLLLMIRITYRNQVVMSRRRVACLDEYFDKVNILVWPRFKLVFDMHVASVREANMRNLWVNDIHPHYITRRYAELAASLLQLSTGYNDNHQLDMNLERLRSTVDDALMQLSMLFPRKQQTIFLINNYDVILSVLKEVGLKGQPENSVGVATQRRAEELLRTYTTVFVEEELGEHFGSLITFVKKAEALLKNETQGAPSEESSEAKATLALRSAGGGMDMVDPLVKDFANRWQSAIASMHKDVLTYFSNFICGLEILKAALTQLLLYYTRFLDIMKRAGVTHKDAVTIPSIMYEIKKYSRTF